MAPNDAYDCDTIIIGAGFSGIRSLWEIQKLGLSVKCFEAGTDIGGAWYWNSYPGARTDSEAWVYAMNFAPNLVNDWDYRSRYPSREEVQQYLCRIVDRFNLRRFIEFEKRIEAIQYSDENQLWTVTVADGSSHTARFVLVATGPLSIPKNPPFANIASFKGEWYQAAKWPKHEVSFHNKRIAIVGTGATGVQIVPKIAPTAKNLTVFQRTPNYVLPGRNYTIDEHQAVEIKENFNTTWKDATSHPFGLAMKPSGYTVKDLADAEKTRRILDRGWECGGFHFQFETFDDIFTSSETNYEASEYVRQKIRAVVRDPKTAELLCPQYPILSKRPPCGHFYYESFNRPNIQLVDISQDTIEVYEKGIQTSSGVEYEFDMIIFALGFDAGTGALSEMDVRGSHGLLLKDYWEAGAQTFAGVMIPEFPNMFLVCGPHVPFGNMPVILDTQVKWIGNTIKYMQDKRLLKIDVTEKAVQAWCTHLEEAFNATLFAESAKKAKAWFVSPGKASKPLFYFGGVPTWARWLESESSLSWSSMQFS
ncbi:hypothetical protein NW762_012795 [Fusarium torreyae]|uniref:Cyclohexanone monooxygenase n=1 Tax=Fusarium torreyae TaxID=1237075 RepID=A0A9W8VB34_9HYPO|nr:hypothetical protein NW762_012795 [Fusarium torreyae]